MWLARFSGHATRCSTSGSTSWSSIGASEDACACASAVRAFCR